MRKFDNAKFGAFVIQSVEEGGKTCSNGLPLVPPTVRMLGRFQHLKAIHHDNICQYLELFRCSLAKNLVILVTEYYSYSLNDLLPFNFSTDLILQISLQIVRGIEHLHLIGFTHGNCDLSTIQVISNGFPKDNAPVTIRLSNYALPYITNNGSDAESTGIISIFSMSPEKFINSEDEFHSSFKSDVWSFGIILLQLYTGLKLKDIWSEEKYVLLLDKLCRSIGENSHQTSLYQPLLEKIKNSGRLGEEFKKDEDIDRIISQCLNLLPSKRPNFENIHLKLKEIIELRNMRLCNVLSQYLDANEIKEVMSSRMNGNNNFLLSELPLEYAFYLWQICGATCENILTKKGFIQLRSPISTLPCCTIEDFVLFGNEESRHFMFEASIFVLPDVILRERISSLNLIDIIHSYLLKSYLKSDSRSQEIAKNEHTLSVTVKEKDVIYQAERILKFRHILDSVAFDDMWDVLKEEARVDIPPAVRSEVWQALLNVSEKNCIDFPTFDTLKSHVSDRQLDVDIPRCHQYKEIMTSPSAHDGLRRILKAWLLSNHNYVYWQGCDSLAAPFLLLNFNRPDIALSCLNEFINRYLYNFFLRDNSAIIQEYLAVFNHLLAYVDAQLYSHLAEMGFFPELYAIPWFLTCFAHVLPMHKLFHVWDQVLLHDTSFPLMVGLSIMKQLRPRLINASFNDAILLFSDLPDLFIDKIIESSINLYNSIPKSCTFRFHRSQWDGSDDGSPTRLMSNMKYLTVNELKEMNCPRISKEEFVMRVYNQGIAVIDIRSTTDFSRGCIIRSINYSNINDTSFKNVTTVFTIAQENIHPICIVWGKDFESAKKFASTLVGAGINGVCILDGGFESVRDDRALITVPH